MARAEPRQDITRGFNLPGETPVDRQQLFGRPSLSFGHFNLCRTRGVYSGIGRSFPGHPLFEDSDLSFSAFNVNGGFRLVACPLVFQD
jgi:hypothetical protein